MIIVRNLHAVIKRGVLLFVMCIFVFSTSAAAEPMSGDELKALHQTNSWYVLNECSTLSEVSGTTNSALEDKLKELAKENTGTTAISVLPLDGGQVVDVNGSVQMPTRSTYKTYVAYATLKAINDKKITWESVQSDFNAMIISSDNAAATRLRLSSAVGGPNGITQLLQKQVGLSEKTIMGSGGEGNSNSQSTSSDFAIFLKKLAKRDLPGIDNDNLYDHLLDAMEAQSARTQGIKDGVGSDTTVADKPGWGPAPDAATNDIGIVYGKNKYTIAILTDYGNENWTYIAKIANEVNQIMQSTSALKEDSSGENSTQTKVRGGTNAEKAFNYFIAEERGLSPEAAAGIVGNLMTESGGNTENLDTTADNGSHYGIAQWDKGDRYIGLAKLAQKQGKTVSNLGVQLDYIWQELNSGYKSVLSELKKSKSVSKAASIFNENYERSGKDPGERIKNGESILSKYKSNAPASSAQAGTGSGCACSSAGSSAISTKKTDGTLPDFVKAYGQAAFDIGKQNGIPYEAILAQAGVESGWGGSELTKQANNFFGIKADDSWKGDTITMRTREEGPSGSYYIDAAFRAYKSPAEGFKGYAEFIKDNDRYKEALKYPGNPVKYIQEVAAAGYATDSSYASTLTSVINNITSYIAEHDLFPPSSEVTPGGSGSVVSTLSDCSSAGGGSVVAVAKQEYEKNKNINEYGGSIKDYTDGRQEAWCADFVSWVYKEAGTPFSGGIGDDGWQYPAVTGLQAWFKEKQIYFEVGKQKPQPGDVAFYIGAQTPDGGSTEHVNIVIAVDGNTMTTIGGNEGAPSQVRKGQRTIGLGESSLVGFGRMK